MKLFTFASATTLLALSGLSSGSPIVNTTLAGALDFNALLDGSLGAMPALLLVSQGTLLEMNAAAPRTFQDTLLEAGP
ncbi:hypothetical protein NX059_010495 [Plenodomus lindquistii]|nr:hypothetical protein NX059_010495 [Plenodomus lindquistii]